MANIKKVLVSGTTYDIEALHFITGSLDTPAQWKDYIDSLVGQGLQIVIDTKSSSADEPATAASASTMGKLYMVAIAEQTQSGTYTEFVTVDKGASASPRYVWEKIGTTAADLTEYAKKGTYTSGAPSSNVTGSAGSETVNTTETDLGSATGSAKIDSHSIAAHSHTVNEVTVSVGSASGWSAGSVPTRQSFDYVSGVKSSGGTANALTGVKVTSSATVNTDAIKEITLSASTVTTAGPAYVEDVTHTAASLTGTKTFVTGYPNFSGGSLTGTKTFNTDAIKSASLDVKTASTTGYQQVVEEVTISDGAVGGSFNTDAIKSIGGTKNYGFSASTSTIMYNPVVNDGILSWSTANAATQDAHTGTAAAKSSPTYTKQALTPTYKWIKVTTTAASTGTVGFTAASLGTASTGTVGIDGGSITKTIKYMGHTTTAASTVSAATAVGANGTATVILSTGLATSSAYQITGVGSVPSLTVTSTTVLAPGTTLSTAGATTLTHTGTGSTTVPVTVAIGKHKHSVTTSNHTHTLSNHTHNVTI